jgi:hypothetical protein
MTSHRSKSVSGCGDGTRGIGRRQFGIFQQLGRLFFEAMFDAYFFDRNQRCVGNKTTDASAFKSCGLIDLLAFLVREVHKSLSPEARLRAPARRS